MKKAKFYIAKRGLNTPIFEQVQGYTDVIADGDHIHEIGYHKPNHNPTLHSLLLTKLQYNPNKLIMLFITVFNVIFFNKLMVCKGSVFPTAGWKTRLIQSLRVIVKIDPLL